MGWVPFGFCQIALFFVSLCAFALIPLTSCASIGPPEMALVEFVPKEGAIGIQRDIRFYRRAVNGKSFASAAKKVVSQVKTTNAFKQTPKLAHQESHLSRTSSSISSSSRSLSRSPSISSHHSEGHRGRSATRGNNPSVGRYHSEPPPGSKNLAHTGWRNIHLSKETKKKGAIAGLAGAAGMVLANVQVNTPSVDVNLVHGGGKKLAMNTQLSQGGISSNFNAGSTSISMNKMTRARSFGGGGGGVGGGGGQSEYM